MENKTLLQQVKEKELAINTRLDRASGDADRLISDAKKECAEIMNKGDEDGRTAALAYFNGEKAKIDAAVDAIRLSASREIQVVNATANRNMPAAVDRIVREVTMR
ncbi:MAG TPA: V-type ATPase subunit subunit G family protein [Methanocella sp.]|uniref:V-type ATPase subunit subunit G family protein n=1 Tax=Methanocella sp. TaxID=2052833 RepID=UPI002B54D91D|nr:V-type ATPase subunit subunit G family protein [Methanocella sp.]HTY90098.1 V-type ATPase subunit subunit G family protein [Methanocella sp.]